MRGCLKVLKLLPAAAKAAKTALTQPNLKRPWARAEAEGGGDSEIARKRWEGKGRDASKTSYAFARGGGDPYSDQLLFLWSYVPLAICLISFALGAIRSELVSDRVPHISKLWVTVTFHVESVFQSANTYRVTI